MELVKSLMIQKTQSARIVNVLHTFYQMKDGSYLAFFEDPERHFNFKRQHDFDLHIALKVEYPILSKMKKKAESFGIEVRGIIDHDFIDSIYLRDPNGYVIELTSTKESSAIKNLDAKKILDIWQSDKKK